MPIDSRAANDSSMFDPPWRSTTAETQPRWIGVPNEELQVGDVISIWTHERKHRICAIRPYTGPLKDIVFAILETDLGTSMSLEIGGMTEVWRTP